MSIFQRGHEENNLWKGDILIVIGDILIAIIGCFLIGYGIGSFAVSIGFFMLWAAQIRGEG